MSLRTRLLLALGYLVVLVTIAFAVPLALNLRDRTREEVRSEARSQIGVLAAGSSEAVAAKNLGDLDVLTRSAGRSARGRVVIVDRAGRVLSDSEGAAAPGALYATQGRPELLAALRGRRVQIERNSETLGEELLVSAEPIFRRGDVVGGVRLSQSVESVNDAVDETMLGILAVGVAVLLTALGVAYLLARGIANPIMRLEEAAERVAGGDLDARAAVEGTNEQRSLARSFNAMTERLGRTVRAQREFAADASHELRTPLTGLRLRLEEARLAEDREALEHELDAGLREVDRIAATVDELLVLSRTGERDTPGELLDPAELAETAGQRWRATAGSAGLVLHVEANGGTRSVWAARADVERALDAVVENAIRYGSAGGSVTIRAVDSRIEVLDEGIGLAYGEEDEIFERFQRGTAGRSGPEGTGLGLAIARELMRCWHGDAQLHNRPEGGARATLTLPPFTGSLPPV
ncbi:MAG TPA: ATP-binding protein [Solirubrobacteraceae bacterium]|nr:ATP-binding protein [Solirubrobacteraceae bacterium]